MARRADEERRNTYLLEHYRPGVGVSGLTRLASLVRDAADEFERRGNPLRFVRSTIVPADESLLCLLEAESEEVVFEAYGCAGISFERISAALLPEDAGSQGNSDSTKSRR